MNERLGRIEDELFNLLGPELREITRIIGETRDKNNSYIIQLPETDAVDLPFEELASLVARTGNAYGRIARFAGMATAMHKLAKGRYDRKFKSSRTGNNDATRTKNAMEASADEHSEMIVAEAIKNIADQLEQAARVASESARKIFDKASAMQVGQAREDHGVFHERDFTH